MKRVFSFVLSLIMVFALTACGRRNDNAPTVAGQPSSESTKAPTETVTEAPVEMPTETPTETAAEPETTGGKTLVVYYSASGNTERVANAIAASANADLFELVPVEPYTSDDLNWTNPDSRVSVEHDDPEQRYVELTVTTVENWDAYDTVFIGFPIWWGIAAWPVNEFIANNDFTGKKVIPFATSSSSGLGESGELLAQATGTGNWLEGNRFSSGASEADVQAWVSSLGL